MRVRMAPSPTGFLHIGLARTFLFNWLFARQQGGECRLRIENTDTNREVAEATEQIQRSLRWLGFEWDGDVTFQLDRLERCQAEAHRLVAEGKAYEDEGAIRFRMPDEGVTTWDDLVHGPIEFRNEELSDLVILRSDGRPLYNFASPIEDWLDGITHVVRGTDHISNTPSQINLLRALGAEIPRYAHVPMINGADGKKLSKRHGALSVEEFKRAGYLREALMNFLALLGWSYDDKTTIMSEGELIERFSFDRVQASPAVFDYQKLDWMNGVYIRELPEASSPTGSSPTSATTATTGTRSSSAARRRSSRRRSRRWARIRSSPASSSTKSSPTRRCSTETSSPAPPGRSRGSNHSRPIGSRRRCARSPRSSSFHRARRSSRSASRSRDPRSLPACSRAWSSWAGSNRSARIRSR